MTYYDIMTEKDRQHYTSYTNELALATALPPSLDFSLNRTPEPRASCGHLSKLEPRTIQLEIHFSNTITLDSLLIITCFGVSQRFSIIFYPGTICIMNSIYPVLQWIVHRENNQIQKHYKQPIIWGLSFFPFLQSTETHYCVIFKVLGLFYWLLFKQE